MASDFGYVVHLKLTRFVFDAPASTPNNNRENMGKHQVGRLFALQWTRCNRPQPVGRTRLVRAGDPVSGNSGAVVDFLSHTSTFLVDEASLSRQQDRVVMFHLTSRDMSPLGAGKDGDRGDDAIVASGTIDLSMFLHASPKSYALTLESNFFSVGRLHFSLYLTQNTKMHKVVQEHAVVLVIENVVDGWFARHGGDRHTGQVAFNAGDHRALLFDDMYFSMKVEMDAEQFRVPVHNALNGKVSFNHVIRLKPAQRVKFVLSDEQKVVGHATVKVDRLTASGFPKDFVLPLKSAKGIDVSLNFTVKEELITREVENSPHEGTTQSSNNESPTPGPQTTASRTSSPRTFADTTTDVVKPGSPYLARAASSPVLPVSNASASATSLKGPTTAAATPAAARAQQPTSPEPAPLSKKISTRLPLKDSDLARLPRIHTRKESSSSPSSSTASRCSSPTVPTQPNDAQSKNNGMLTAVARRDSTGSKATASVISLEDQGHLGRRVQVLELMLQEAHDKIFQQERLIAELTASLQRPYPAMQAAPSYTYAALPQQHFDPEWHRSQPHTPPSGSFAYPARYPAALSNGAFWPNR
jgi:hypothetical protein